jgi:hypothetical protein
MIFTVLTWRYLLREPKIKVKILHDKNVIGSVSIFKKINLQVIGMSNKKRRERTLTSLSQGLHVFR